MPIKPENKARAIQRIGNKLEIQFLNERIIVVSSVELRTIHIG